MSSTKQSKTPASATSDPLLTGLLQSLQPGTFIRLRQLVGRPARPANGTQPADPGEPGLLPIGASTVWRWVSEGRFPKPVKLSGGVTAWSSDAIRAHLMNASGS